MRRRYRLEVKVWRKEKQKYSYGTFTFRTYEQALAAVKPYMEPVRITEITSIVLWEGGK